MSVYRRNKIWYYEFKIKGTRYKKSVPTARLKTDAEQAEAEAKHQIHQGIYGKPTGNHGFIKFARTEFFAWADDNWSDPTKARSYVNTFAEFFKQRTFAEISSIQIEAYKQFLKKTPIKEPRRNDPTISVLPRLRSVKTINRHLAVLSRIFRLAIKNKKTDHNPVADVERYHEGEGRKRFLIEEENEADRLLAELDNQPDHLKNFVLIALHTGMRFSEIKKLHVDFIDWQNNEVILPDPKSKREERVPINPFVQDLLHTLEPINGWLLANPKTGKPYVDLKNGMKKLFAAAGLEDFTFHCIRHSFATELVDQTKDLATAQKILRHKDIKTTMIYAHVKDQRKREAVAKVGNFWNKVPNQYPTNNMTEFKRTLTG